jgi:hypothetical protein
MIRTKAGEIKCLKSVPFYTIRGHKQIRSQLNLVQWSRVPENIRDNRAQYRCQLPSLDM